MKYLDKVIVIVEKEKYAKYGVHQGMHGWICDERKINGTWLVNFPQCGEKPDIETISVKEEDLEVIPIMYAIINEQIKSQFDKNANDEKR